MNIKEMRMSANLTQQDLGEQLGVGRTTVAMWENGDAMPRADKLPEIAKVLGCTINDLFGDEE